MAGRRISNAKKRKELNIPPVAGGSDPQLEKAGKELQDSARVGA